MTPLNFQSIANRYADNFDISADQANKLAAMTKGYPFAFQALGYSVWNHGLDGKKYYDEYRQILQEYIYDKIWSELSAKDRKVAIGIERSKTGKVKTIIELLNFRKGELNQYRKRLIRKGIVNGDEYGYLRFELPLFEEFIREQMIFEGLDGDV